MTADVVQVAIGYDSKRADRRQYAALRAVDLAKRARALNQVALAATGTCLMARTYVKAAIPRSA
jgi:hypothetical protein